MSTASQTETDVRDLAAGDIILWGQSLVRIQTVEHVGNNGVVRVFGYTGTDGASVSRPVTEFYNKGQTVDVVN